MRRLRAEQSGYSMVEVLAAIIILSLAILPMVSMFDAGLRAAVLGGNYDTGRALANSELEEAKSLSYEEVRDGFPESSSYDGSGNSESSWKDAGGDFEGFEYRVSKQYLEQPSVDPDSSSESFEESDGDAGLLRVTVTARWDDDSTYSTSGMVVE